MLYSIQGTVTVNLGIAGDVTSHTSTRQIPTFLLDSDIQGIRNEDDAIRVARSVILTSTTSVASVSVTASEYIPRTS